ncbi:hypothetical protein B5X24_HaOG209349 [Helicoverpa armigera]|nr:hypothetical protein B5X24_HaOG209349 [Helicoverpa armigera]
MIFRLVYRFLFLNLITGILGFDVTREARTPVDQKVSCDTLCNCQDQRHRNTNPDPSSLLQNHSQMLSEESPLLKKIKNRYGYRTPSLPISNTAHAYSSASTSYAAPSTIDMAPQSINIVEEGQQVAEKSLCFSPKAVKHLVKTAMDYVTQITQLPAELRHIVDLIDQDLDSLPDHTLEEQQHKLYKPQHPERTNFILQYEVPSAQDQAQCKDALDSLIEIAYKAYLELMEHPQCKEYLYNFASNQPDDRPTGYAEQAPGLKTLIITILDLLDTKKPKTPPDDRYGDINPGDLPTLKLKIPKHYAKVPYNEYPTKEYLIPSPEYQSPNEYRYPTTEYIIPKTEYFPTKEYHIPSPEIQITQKEYILPSEEYRYPASEFQIPKEYVPNEEYVYPYIPINNKYITAPNYHKPKKEYMTTEEFDIPKQYDIPKEYEIPTSDYLIPEDIRLPAQPYIPKVPIPQEITIVDSEETDLPKILRPVLPDAQQPIIPENIIDYIIKLLENDDNAPIVELIDNVKIVTDSHPQNIRPYIMKLLKLLTFVPKEHNDIPRIIEILTNLLNSQKNEEWPLSDTLTEQILSFVKPDESGTIDTRILDIILNLIKMKPHETQVKHILHLLKPYQDGELDQILADILIRLIKAYRTRLLRPDQIDILFLLLQKSKNGIDEPKAIDVANNLDRWNEIGINPKQLELIFNNLKPYAYGQTDSKPLDIIHFLLTQSTKLSRPQLDFILTFLNPSMRGVDIKRIDIIHFLLGILHMYPGQVTGLLELLMEDTPGVMNSRFVDILIFLNNEGLLTPELIEIITQLLQNDVMGELDENQIKSLLVLLKPYKQSNPKMVVDILTLLNQGGLHSNLLEWFKSPQPDVVEVPIYQPQDIGIIDQVNGPKLIYDQPRPNNQDRIPSIAIETPDNDVSSIIDWLQKQGIFSPDSGTNPEIVNNIVKILQMGDRELGVVELTYMLKHMKPLIYHPVYYVKYRLPIMSFITNFKALLKENPHLAANPMKLLQELILISNVTEVSPNLQGYPKDEIMKLTFNGGDLIQAKILDEQNQNLNDQIKYVQSLNTGITPEELLELNKVNEAKYFPKVVQFQETSIPEKIVINKVVVPSASAHFRHYESGPIITQGSIKTIHHKLQRSNDNPASDENESSESADSEDEETTPKPTPSPTLTTTTN